MTSKSVGVLDVPVELVRLRESGIWPYFHSLFKHSSLFDGLLSVQAHARFPVSASCVAVGASQAGGFSRDQFHEFHTLVCRIAQQKVQTHRDKAVKMDKFKTDLYDSYQQSLEQFCDVFLLPDTEISSPSSTGHISANDFKTSANINYSSSSSGASADSPSALLLRRLADKYTLFKLAAKGLQALFEYLDRYYCNFQGNKVLPLAPSAARLFQRKLLGKQQIRRVCSAVDDVVNRDRQGEPQDRSLIKCICTMFVELGHAAYFDFTLNAPKPAETVLLEFYLTELEKPSVSAAYEYYSGVAKRQLEEESIASYLERCERLLSLERFRGEAMFQSRSVDHVITRAHDALLKDCQSVIINKKSGFDYLLTVGGEEHLSRMYRLYKRSNPENAQIKALAAAFRSYLADIGKNLVDEMTLKKKQSPSKDTEVEEKTASEECADSSSTLAAVASTSSATPNSAENLVQSIIAIHYRFSSLIVKCFEKQLDFLKGLRAAFVDFVNADNKVAAYLAKYAHEVLKKNSKVNANALTNGPLTLHAQHKLVSAMTAASSPSSSSSSSSAASSIAYSQDGEMDLLCENIVLIYGYFNDKDIFERDYHLFLCDRLLKLESANEFREREMISRLKSQCGYAWTYKLEKMLEDVRISQELSHKFAQDRIGAAPSPLQRSTSEQLFADGEFKLEVNVCTTGIWPSQGIEKMAHIKCPNELATTCDKFKRFYTNRYEGHKLTWRFDLGSAEVYIDFSQFAPATNGTLKPATTSDPPSASSNTAGRRYLMVVTTFQLFILLCFNSASCLRYRQLLDITGVPRALLADHLLSLCHPRCRVLDKKPAGRDLDDDHLFRVNPNFVSNVKRVAVPLIRFPVQNSSALLNASEAESEQRKSELMSRQRACMMDAAICRIMKARKKLKHQELVYEVVHQLNTRFKPNPSDLKKRIEAMINGEYIARLNDQRDSYIYQA